MSSDYKKVNIQTALDTWFSISFMFLAMEVMSCSHLILKAWINSEYD